eukprot:COSAG05_NODE_93_length_19581_cov_53.686685_11_plen_208_part_00
MTPPNPEFRISGSVFVFVRIRIRITNKRAHALALAGRYSTPAAHTALRDEAAGWWQNYWSKSEVLLPSEPLLSFFWHSAQYAMGSASRPGKLAPSAYGPWVTNDMPAWLGDYCMDYNVEAQYYGTEDSRRITDVGASERGSEPATTTQSTASKGTSAASVSDHSGTGGSEQRRTSRATKFFNYKVPGCYSLYKLHKLSANEIVALST